MEAILEVRNISKQFTRNRGDSNVFYPVKNIEFLLKRGEIAMLSGKSGSGKTTFLNMVAGILEPTEGDILIEGKNMYQMNDKDLSLFRNSKIGNIPQGQTAIHSLTVIENVMLPVMLYYKDKATYNEKVKLAETLLDKMKITDLKDVMPSELSGGELRRVAVARALIMNPELILADEPTSDLDEVNTNIILQMLQEVAKTGVAVIVVTHDKEVSAIADTIYEMKEGVLQLGGEKDATN